MIAKRPGKDGKLYPTQRANVDARTRQLVGMWCAGWSAQDIAAALDVSIGTVYRAIPAELR